MTTDENYERELAESKRRLHAEIPSVCMKVFAANLVAFGIESLANGGSLVIAPRLAIPTAFVSVGLSLLATIPNLERWTGRNRIDRSHRDDLGLG